MDWWSTKTDLIPFVDKTRKQYYPDKIDMLKDAVSISGISMTYVLNKALKIKKSGDPAFPNQGNLAITNAMKDALE